MKNKTTITDSPSHCANIMLAAGRNLELKFSDFTDLGFVPTNGTAKSDDIWSFEKSYLQSVYTVKLIYTNDFRKRLEVICLEVGKDKQWHLCTGISIDVKDDLIWLINHLYILRRFIDTV